MKTKLPFSTEIRTMLPTVGKSVQSCANREISAKLPLAKKSLQSCPHWWNHSEVAPNREIKMHFPPINEISAELPPVGIKSVPSCPPSGQLKTKLDPRGKLEQSGPPSREIKTKLPQQGTHYDVPPSREILQRYRSAVKSVGSCPTARIKMSPTHFFGSSCHQSGRSFFFQVLKRYLCSPSPS